MKTKEQPSTMSLSITSLIFAAISMSIIVYYLNWQIALAMFLYQWAANISRAVKEINKNGADDHD